MMIDFKSSETCTCAFRLMHEIETARDQWIEVPVLIVAGESKCTVLIDEWRHGANRREAIQKYFPQIAEMSAESILDHKESLPEDVLLRLPENIEFYEGVKAGENKESLLQVDVRWKTKANAPIGKTWAVKEVNRNMVAQRLSLTLGSFLERLTNINKPVDSDDRDAPKERPHGV